MNNKATTNISWELMTGFSRAFIVKGRCIVQAASFFQSYGYVTVSLLGSEDKLFMTYDVNRHKLVAVQPGCRSLTTVVSLYAPPVCLVRAWYHGLTTCNRNELD